jgi:hypothetical protein
MGERIGMHTYSSAGPAQQPAGRPSTHPGQLEVPLCLAPVLMPPLNYAAVQLNLAAAPAHLQARGMAERQMGKAGQAGNEGL